MIRKKFYFDDVFADILLMHTLNHATFKGAETGECLAAAAKVVEGNAESWRRAWQEQGEKAERAGRLADDRGHRVSAREAYLRAVTYYYHACLAIPVDDPAYRAGVEHYRSLFQRFAALSSPPIEVTGIPYQGTRLPAYFLRPDSSGEAHPTVVIGDNTSEELYYWVGPPGVERGYNVLLVDLPGMGLNTFHGIYFRPDTEVAVGACIDYLSKRRDVDPSRIAFYGGGEPGGWVAVRAAAREPRLAACIAALSDGPQTVPGQAEQTVRFYEGEPGRGYARMVAEPERIQCPLLCLNDPTDQEELRLAGRGRRRGGAESGLPPSGLRARGRHRPLPTARQLQPQAPRHVRLAGRSARPALTRPAAPAARVVTTVSIAAAVHAAASATGCSGPVSRIWQDLRHDHERHGAVASEAYRDGADDAVAGVEGTANQDQLGVTGAGVAAGGGRRYQLVADEPVAPPELPGDPAAVESRGGRAA